MEVLALQGEVGVVGDNGGLVLLMLSPDTPVGTGYPHPSLTLERPRWQPLALLLFTPLLFYWEAGG